MDTPKTPNYMDGKPTISPSDHADNFGQREHKDHEGTKHTISNDNHDSNFGQRCGYDDHEDQPERAK